MSNFLSHCKAFASDEQGATAIEYALIASILSIAIAASLTTVRGELSTTFTNVGAQLQNHTAAN